MTIDLYETKTYHISLSMISCVCINTNLPMVIRIMDQISWLQMHLFNPSQREGPLEYEGENHMFLSTIVLEKVVYSVIHINIGNGQHFHSKLSFINYL